MALSSCKDRSLSTYSRFCLTFGMLAAVAVVSLLRLVMR
jgi:hypothetical protein